jgi:hypothetical protein
MTSPGPIDFRVIPFSAILIPFNLAAMEPATHVITTEDVDKFLDNLLHADDIGGSAAYVHEKMKVVAHRRLVHPDALVAAGLINCMTLLLLDLENGKDGYDAKATMPHVPGITMAITTAHYPSLWRHLPEKFVGELKEEADGAGIPPGCAVM